MPSSCLIPKYPPQKDKAENKVKAVFNFNLPKWEGAVIAPRCDVGEKGGVVLGDLLMDQPIPSSRARTLACVREATSSLRYILVRWDLTVHMLITSFSAIARLL